MSKVFCFEGVDGVGKSTTMKAVSEALTKLGIEHVLTKEPGGPRALMDEWGCTETDYPFGVPYTGYRDLCVNHAEIGQDVKRALYKADAITNWNTIVKPALESGVIVLSDRCYLSGIAYGAALTKYSLEQMYQFESSLCQEAVATSRIILLELNPTIREERLSMNIADEADKFGVDKRNLIAAKYEEAVNRYLSPEHVLRINTAIPTVVIASQILNFINKIGP